MASGRDILAELMSVAMPWAWTPPAQAVDAVLAAGWRPPARGIETAEELDKLPSGSVVVHSPCPDEHACTWQSGTGGWWFTPGDGCPYEPHDLISHCGISGRLLLLWEPS
ncbi:hypothetical protein, partial [Mycobacterium sp. NS-7484]|uniref:hypothetical protein n=1 Tax=Mycobacterium sp. NS-7484 TaxID=1834161 RepID=UPI001152C91A